MVHVFPLFAGVLGAGPHGLHKADTMSETKTPDSKIGFMAFSGNRLYRVDGWCN